jgi:enoyl-CoA hydratase/carnithine racemase
VDLTTLEYREDDGVAWVTLNRPEVHNAFNTTMQHELSSVWQSLRHNDAVRVAVLTGAGERAFCTGIDRSEIMEHSEVWDPMTYDDPGLRLGPRSQRLWKPVIAAVNGMAAGGAFYLLGEVDFIIAADHATFFDPHVTYGMPAVFEPITMFHRMPFGEVMRMTLMGTHERISARRAMEIGLVTEVVPYEELHEAAARAARSIAAQPPGPIQASLRTLWAARELTAQQATDLGNVFLNLSLSQAALAEGQEQFTSKQRVEPRIR